MNDPAVLFYTSDFLTGVIDMTMEERGQYITLLCYQHQKGHIKEETIRLLVGSASVNVLKHFVQDNDGLFYNKRMDIEKEKRHVFVESRRENGSKGGRPKKEKEKPSDKPKKNLVVTHMDNHMGNENINENININVNNIIDYLNIKTNKHFKYTTNNISKIKARIKEGFTENDFKEVIDKKCLEWLNDKEMNKYLRPETLFGNKFEGYLQQNAKKMTLKDISIQDIQKIKEQEYEKDRIYGTNENNYNCLF